MEVVLPTSHCCNIRGKQNCRVLIVFNVTVTTVDVQWCEWGLGDLIEASLSVTWHSSTIFPWSEQLSEGNLCRTHPLSMGNLAAQQKNIGTLLSSERLQKEQVMNGLEWFTVPVCDPKAFTLTVWAAVCLHSSCIHRGQPLYWKLGEVIRTCCRSWLHKIVVFHPSYVISESRGKFYITPVFCCPSWINLTKSELGIANTYFLSRVCQNVHINFRYTWNSHSNPTFQKRYIPKKITSLAKATKCAKTTEPRHSNTGGKNRNCTTKCPQGVLVTTNRCMYSHMDIAEIEYEYYFKWMLQIGQMDQANW